MERFPSGSANQPALRALGSSTQGRQPVGCPKLTCGDERGSSVGALLDGDRELVDDADEQPPEALDGRDAHALVW